MPVPLNKSALKEQRDHLQMYERFLPSLDLKRQQLIAELQHARDRLATREREIADTLEARGGLFSLMGASEQDLSGLVQLESAQFKEENVLGVRMPALGEVRFHVAEYSMLAKPFWVDFLVEVLQQVTELRLHRDIEHRRVQLLGDAVRRVTQRVNLFEKVLIPQARENIQRIRVYLADTDRAAVVRSKIAKTKHRQSEQSKRVN